ncbi:MAG TPA: phosphonoacetaldehyde hydrolase [Planctomycetaceae bacterium]|nr:phosphonoacetaldehyde hydrolase [Blastopirellula sp.]HAY81327.1 phosphonoacetaldehyde hydrolase [Planctomycetaceae bacterium]
MNYEAKSTINLVIFDLGGTIVDHGCMAPVRAFIKAFEQVGVVLDADQVRGPMGLGKVDHIRELFRLPSASEQWRAKGGGAWSEDDVASVYELFLPLQTELAKHHTDIIPGLPECWRALQSAGVLIGTTTGYPRDVADPILKNLAQAGFTPDAHVCNDEVPAGRPEPYMIENLMDRLDVRSRTAVLKVGDTVPDMEAARNARVWAVGITESGSEFGMTQEDLEALAPTDRAAKHVAAEQKLRDAGAHKVVKSLSEIAPLVLSDVWSEE